ncbi:uncharacterized protein FMAN_12839 [Fusarium mangiferae]|uniref:Uncharacterized protein n=1 Tax=Fusarium mangiferae TaxID=192010 RepID=A0A1L7UB70_FUSMA|nr:uncharacterized protein FMAN_12839 [Fusarium mangiferae]CVL04741.1 uncharacterized protein FMAN_12839 [Fusarium mangiferae]
MGSGAVLVIGATGNIGVAVAIAALKTGRQVIAPVRNSASAAKLFEHAGTRDGITTVEADVTSEDGIRHIVERVEAGKLPAFQHVYSSGIRCMESHLDPETRYFFFSISHGHNSGGQLLDEVAYRATIPYLLKQADPDSTWTIVTGAAGELGAAGATAVAQGALFTLANVGCRELADTNVRFNEVHLSFRVDYDAVAKQKQGGSVPSSQLAAHYVNLLARRDISGSRINLGKPEDIEKLPFTKKLG